MKFIYVLTCLPLGLCALDGYRPPSLSANNLNRPLTQYEINQIRQAEEQRIRNLRYAVNLNNPVHNTVPRNSLFISQQERQRDGQRLRDERTRNLVPHTLQYNDGPRNSLFISQQERQHANQQQIRNVLLGNLPYPSVQTNSPTNFHYHRQQDAQNWREAERRRKQQQVADGIAAGIDLVTDALSGK